MRLGDSAILDSNGRRGSKVKGWEENQLQTTEGPARLPNHISEAAITIGHLQGLDTESTLSFLLSRRLTHDNFVNNSQKIHKKTNETQACPVQIQSRAVSQQFHCRIMWLYGVWGTINLLEPYFLHKASFDELVKRHAFRNSRSDVVTGSGSLERTVSPVAAEQPMMPGRVAHLISLGSSQVDSRPAG